MWDGVLDVEFSSASDLTVDLVLVETVDSVEAGRFDLDLALGCWCCWGGASFLGAFGVFMPEEIPFSAGVRILRVPPHPSE